MKYQHLVIFFLGAVLLATSAPSAAAGKGGIPEDLIDRLSADPLNDRDRAMSDILANQNIKNIALNRQRFIEHNKFVNHKISTANITNQESSGRCWMFAGLNVLRPQAMKNLKVKTIEFSQNYILFWDKMEKLNLFLQLMIDYADRPIDDRELEYIINDVGGDGGWWPFFTALVDKYGLIPKEVMPETVNSSSTGDMNKFLVLKAKEMGVRLREAARGDASKKDLEEKKHEMLGEIYRLLILHLGEPPREFTWRYETTDTTVKGTIVGTYTPQSFYRAAITDTLADFIALFDLPMKEYFKNYSLRLSRNIYDMPDFTVLNLPIDTLKAYAMVSVIDSMPVWFTCDVGQENYSKDGIMALDIYDYEAILGTTFDLPKADLMRMRLIGPTHAMAFIGADTADGRAVKWLVENSWGDERGDKGMWYMYNDWFDRYMYGVIVHKRYLSEELKKLSRVEPIVLPPWDPMSCLKRLQ